MLKSTHGSCWKNYHSLCSYINHHLWWWNQHLFMVKSAFVHGSISICSWFNQHLFMMKSACSWFNHNFSWLNQHFFMVKPDDEATSPSEAQPGDQLGWILSTRQPASTRSVWAQFPVRSPMGKHSQIMTIIWLNIVLYGWIGIWWYGLIGIIMS